MKITITLTTGNAAFQTSGDVATALRELEGTLITIALSAGTTPIKDANGNNVGTCNITEE